MSTPWVVAFALMWLVLILVVIVLLGLVRRVSEVLERSAAAASVDQLAVGAPLLSVIRTFELTDADGARRSFPDFISRAALMLFIGADCPACEMLLEQITEVGATVDGMPLFLVVDDEGEHQRPLGAPAGLQILYQSNSDATEAFNNRATPQAYVVDRHGVVLERRIPGSLVHLREMAMHQWEKGDGHDNGRAAEGHTALAARGR